MTKMMNIQPNDLIEKIAKELKSKEDVKAPEWAMFVKTGVHKERPPADEDWWYFRLAAVLRSVYILGPIGVSKLRTKYGGKQRRGHKPAKFARGSGSIIRKSLQQLESLKFIKQTKIGVHSGRVITKEGKEFVDSLAGKTEASKKTEDKKE